MLIAAAAEDVVIEVVGEAIGVEAEVASRIAINVEDAEATTKPEAQMDSRMVIEVMLTAFRTDTTTTE